MLCPACQHLNNAHARFCNACGASLAPLAWAEPVSRDGVYTIEPSLSPQFLPQANTIASAPAPAAPMGYAPAPFYPAPAQAFSGYAPASAQGYAAAPMPGVAPSLGPSLVNNVTVTQVTPPIPTVAADHHLAGLALVLVALFFLLSGVGIGMLLMAGAGAWAVALPLMALMLVLNIFLLGRLTRH